MMISRMIDRMMMTSYCPVHQLPHIETSTQTFPPPIADFTLSKIAWHWHLGFTCKEIYIKHIFDSFHIDIDIQDLHKKLSQRHAPPIFVQNVKNRILKLNTWFCWLSLASKKILQFRKRFVLLPVDFQNSLGHSGDQDSHWTPFFYLLRPVWGCSQFKYKSLYT